MTLSKPSFFISRLVVQSGAKIVYDEKFRPGVNVVYGENASGKSTILEFIYHVLGGEGATWKQKARSCDKVTAEVLVNGNAITLSREVSNAPRLPISIFWGGIEKALASAMEGWERFPYSRSSSKDSYSQVMFRSLEMPEVPASDSSKLTMHQLLRLMYADQLSSPDVMFRPDRFDQILTRQTIGELVCGVYDPQLYANQLLLVEKKKGLEVAEAELRSLIRALGPIGADFGLVSVDNEIVDVQKETTELAGRLDRIDEGTADQPDEDALKELSAKRREIQTVESKVSVLEAQREQHKFQILEDKRFAEALGLNLSALKQSDVVLSEFGAIDFEYCPACLEPVENSDIAACHLCKTPLAEDVGKTQHFRLLRELEMQIRETSAIEEQVAAESIKTDAELRKAKAALKKQVSEYEVLRASSFHLGVAQGRDLFLRLGWLERQMEVLTERREIALRVNELSVDKAELTSEISQIEDTISAEQGRQKTRRMNAYTLLSDITRELLSEDLDREDSFANAGHVSFDFAKESISVDGETTFAASSQVYLKNSFALAMLLSSLRDDQFRYPRFLVLDGIEDKGMEADRIKHFQRLMLKKSEEATVDHQVIISGEIIDQSLIEAGLVVGRRYTHDRKALDFD